MKFKGYYCSDAVIQPINSIFEIAENKIFCWSKVEVKLVFFGVAEREVGKGRKMEGG